MLSLKSRSQWRLRDQNVIVSSVFSEVLILMQPNLVRWYIIKSQSLKDWIIVFTVKVTMISLQPNYVCWVLITNYQILWKQGVSNTVSIRHYISVQGIFAMQGDKPCSFIGLGKCINGRMEKVCIYVYGWLMKLMQMMIMMMHMQ